jgi:hypothetical protein
MMLLPYENISTSIENDDIFASMLQGPIQELKDNTKKASVESSLRSLYETAFNSGMSPITFSDAFYSLDGARPLVAAMLNHDMSGLPVRMAFEILSLVTAWNSSTIPVVLLFHKELLKIALKHKHAPAFVTNNVAVSHILNSMVLILMNISRSEVAQLVAFEEFLDFVIMVMKRFPRIKATQEMCLIYFLNIRRFDGMMELMTNRGVATLMELAIFDLRGNADHFGLRILQGAAVLHRILTNTAPIYIQKGF